MGNFFLQIRYNSQTITPCLFQKQSIYIHNVFLLLPMPSNNFQMKTGVLEKPVAVVLIKNKFIRWQQSNLVKVRCHQSQTAVDMC